MSEIVVVPRQFIIAGHSHIFALGADQGYAGETAIEASDHLGPGGFFLMENWHAGRPPAYWEALERNAKGRDIILAYYGNQHHSHFLFFAGQPLEFVFDEADIVEPEKVLLTPKRAVTSFMDGTMSQLRIIIQRLRGAGAERVFVLGTPGQRRDIETYANQILQSDFAKGFLAPSETVEALRMTPAHTLLKLWKTLQASMAQLCSEEGAAFIPIPHSTLDQEGYLAAQYANGDDLSHANTEYGNLAVKNIRLTLALANSQ